MDVVDITNEAAPVIPSSCVPFINRHGSRCSFISSVCNATNADDDFESVSTASQFSQNVGFFYYHQPGGDACSTSFTGQVSNNLALTSTTPAGTLSVNPSSPGSFGTFPTMGFAGMAGMGDYVGIVKEGLPGGYLYPSWSQPVNSSASCVSCQGAQRSLAIFATRVLL
jgi:hypothetical protein